MKRENEKTKTRRTTENESSIARAGGYALKYLSETRTWLHEVTE